MMKVNVKCFSQVQYALGQTELLVELENGSKASDLEKLIRWAWIHLPWSFSSQTKL